jgi:biopolymer transport protein ExbD
MNWILRKRGDGRSFGPLDDDALRRWAWDGLIDPDDELSDDDGSTWGRAGAAAVLESFLREQARLPVLVEAATIPLTAQRRRRKGSLLDLTPLVDCVFLLLIFFFVATTFDAGSASVAAGSESGSDVIGLDVSTPKVDDRPEKTPPVPRQVHVVVTESGIIAVDGRQVSLSSLAKTIRSLRSQHDEITAIVLADSQVKYGQIARVVAAIEAGGVERVLIGATGSDK